MVVAYLASEIPSTSATFVYREILEVEKQGHRVIPFTMRRTRHLAVEASAQELAQRVNAVYERPLRQLFRALKQALLHPVMTGRALNALREDALKTPVSRWFKLAFKFVAGMALASQLRQDKCAHLHIHFAHAPATVGMYAALAAGIPFSITAHANDIYENAELLESKLKRAQPFITISEYNRRHLQRCFPGSRVEVVRCGIGDEAAPVDEIRPLRNAHETLNILGVGRLVPKKGFDVLLHALVLLDAANVSWRCAIAGDGPEDKRLREFAAELKLPSEQLSFLGALPPCDVAGLLQCADVFALPCRKEKNGDVDGIPVVLMEALALGVPCISTKLSGIPELISHGETGLLVPPDDAMALAEALRRISEAPAQAHKLAQRGQAFVRREFSRERNAACLIKLWTEAAGSNRDAVPQPQATEVERHVESPNRNRFAGPRRSSLITENH